MKERIFFPFHFLKRNQKEATVATGEGETIISSSILIWLAAESITIELLKVQKTIHPKQIYTTRTQPHSFL